MASVIKTRVLEALGERLASVVDPDIAAGDVIVGPAGADRIACWPNLVIEAAGPFKFEPFDEDEIWSTDASLTVQVGDLSGRVSVTLGFTNQGQRSQLEDRVLHEFYKQTGRRGVLVVQLDDFEVGGLDNLGTLPIAYILGDEEWVEEMVFEKKRFSRLTLDVDIPCLARLDGVYTIETLVSAVTADLTADDPTIDEQVSIAEDGDVAEYP